MTEDASFCTICSVTKQTEQRRGGVWRPRVSGWALCLLGAAGCTDYGLNAEKLGLLRVSPEAVVLEGACSFEEQVVTLQSVGEHPVTIRSVEVVGEGWVLLSTPALP